MIPVTRQPQDQQADAGYPDEQAIGRPLLKQKETHPRTKRRVAKDLLAPCATHLLAPPYDPHSISAVVGPEAVPLQLECHTAGRTGDFLQLGAAGRSWQPRWGKKKDPVVPPLRQPIGVKKRKTPSPTVATIVIPRSGWGVAADVSAIHCYVLIPFAYPSTSSRRLLG